jgi:hypothetical protein
MGGDRDRIDSAGIQATFALEFVLFEDFALKRTAS